MIREFFELTRGVKDNPKYQHPHCQDFPLRHLQEPFPNGDGFRVHSERHRIYSLYRVGITRHIQFPFWTRPGTGGQPDLISQFNVGT